MRQSLLCRPVARTLAAIGPLAVVLAICSPAAAQPSRQPLRSRPILIPPEHSAAQQAPASLPTRDQLVELGIYRLDGLDAALPHDDLRPLRQILEGAQVVGLGETVHTSGGYYRMKHRLVRYLVEEMGFRAFAMEAQWPYADVTAAYVATCQGTVNDAMDYIFGVFASAETGALLTYLCNWNQTHPDDPVTFFGFDVQQPHLDGPALISFLHGQGVQDTDPLLVGLRRCDGVVTFQIPVDEADNAACVAALAGIDALLAALDPSDAVQRENADVEYAKIRSIGVRSWQGLVYAYDAGDFIGADNARDGGMAAVFQRLRTLRVGSAKTAIWAHNYHIAKGGYGFAEAGLQVMGDRLSRDLGGRYAAVALAAASVSIDWPGVGCGPLFVYSQSAERRLRLLDEPFLLVDLDFNGTNANQPPYLDPRVPIRIGFDFYVPGEHFDALVYLRTSPAMSPTWWPSCSP